jgi:hypothetical protein
MSLYRKKFNIVVPETGLVTINPSDSISMTPHCNISGGDFAAVSHQEYISMINNIIYKSYSEGDTSPISTYILIIFMLVLLVSICGNVTA